MNIYTKIPNDEPTKKEEILRLLKKWIHYYRDGAMATIVSIETLIISVLLILSQSIFHWVPIRDAAGEFTMRWILFFLYIITSVFVSVAVIIINTASCIIFMIDTVYTEHNYDGNW